MGVDLEVAASIAGRERNRESNNCQDTGEGND